MLAVLVGEFSLVELHTFLEAASEFSRFTPNNFFDCVKALELVIKFSESRELRINHRSCFAPRNAFCVFKLVNDSAIL